MGVRGTGRGWRVRSAAVVAIAGLLTALMAVVVPSAASAATVDVTGGTSLHLLSQSFTTTSGTFCNVIWVAYVPVTQGVDNYDVQVHDNNPLGQGPYQTAFPYANDTFFDGNVTWTAPTGFHQIPMAEVFTHDCAAGEAAEAGRYTLLSASATPTGSIIQGQVFDATGAPLAGKLVNITGPNGRFTFTVTSQVGGWYLAPNSLPGSYTVSVAGGSVTECSGTSAGGVCTLDVTATTASHVGGGTASFTLSPVHVTSVAVTGKPGAASGPAAGGTPITITGSGFGAPGAADGVALTGPNASASIGAGSVVVVNDTTITAVTGSASSSIPTGQNTFVTDVRVTAGGNTSPLNAPGDRFTYKSGVTVTAVSPTSGSAKNAKPVTVSGTGFGTAGSADSVAFCVVGTTQCLPGAGVSVASDSSLSATPPADASSLIPSGQSKVVTDVVVTDSAGNSSPTSAADNYTFTTVEVDAVSPDALDVGTPGPSWTVTGTGFTGASSVGFFLGATQVFHFDATKFTVNGDGTQIVIPPTQVAAIESILHTDVGDLAKYTFDVRVTADGFMSPVNSPGDQFVYRGPQVTGVTPIEVSLGGSKPPVFTVSGSGFTGATSLGFYRPGSIALGPLRVFHINPTHFVVSPDGTSITTDAVILSGIRGAIRAAFGTEPPPYDLMVAVSTGAITSDLIAPPTVKFTGPEVDAVEPAELDVGTSGPSWRVTGKGFTGASSLDFYLGGKRVFHLNANLLTVNADGTQLVTAPVQAARIENILHADVGDLPKYTFDVRVTVDGFTSPVNSPGDEFLYDGPVVNSVSPTTVSLTDTRAPVFTVHGTGLTGATAVGVYVTSGPLLTTRRIFHINPSNFAVSPDGTSITTSPITLAAIRALLHSEFGSTPPPYVLSVGVSVGAITSDLLGAPTVEFTGPTVDAVSPAELDVGALPSWTVTGSGFNGASSVGFYLGGVRVFHFNASKFSVNGAGTEIVIPPVQVAAIESILHKDVGDRPTYTFDVRVTADGFTSAVNAPADQFVYDGPVVNRVAPSSLSLSGTQGPVFTVTGSGFTGATSLGFYEVFVPGVVKRVFHINPSHFVVSSDGTTITTDPISLAGIRSAIRAAFGNTPPPYQLTVGVSTGAITSNLDGALEVTFTR